MFQSLHIFRKDARHLWPEILVTLVLFAGFAGAAPSHWTGSVYAGIVGLLAALLHVLIPIAWLVLISRVIHDEPLVGDRQFWTSRPYHWGKLLGAKVLFLVAFIYLPFLVMQCYLLKHAGLYPTTVIPSLLHNLLILTLFFILPITALASVTSTFARLLLSILGAIVYVLAVGGIFGWYTWERMPAPHVSVILGTVYAILLGAILVGQYAFRRTNEARIALAGLPVFLLLFALLLPNRLLIPQTYPKLAQENAPKLSALPDELMPHANPTDQLVTFRGKVNLQIPMQVAGIDENTLYHIDGYTLTIDSPGVHWTSPWQVSGQQLNGGLPAALVQVPIPLSLFQQIRKTPVDLHLTLALEHLYVSPTAYSVKATRAAYSVPAHGICNFDTADESNPDSVTPVCRFPFQQPDNVFVAAPLAPGSCAEPASVPGHGSLGTPSDSVSFDPVDTIPLRLATGDPDASHHYMLCPDTMVSFYQAKAQGKGSVVFDQKGIVLDSLAARIVHQSPRRGPAMPLQPMPMQPEQQGVPQ